MTEPHHEMDPQRISVLASELIVARQLSGVIQSFSSREAASAWVSEITGTSWFQKEFPWFHQFEILEGPPESGPSGYRIWWVGTLLIPNAFSNELGILHGLAQVLSEVNHGREFASTYLALVRKFSAPSVAKLLQQCFVHLKVLYKRAPSAANTLFDGLTGSRNEMPYVSPTNLPAELVKEGESGA